MMAAEHPRSVPCPWRDEAACQGMDPNLFHPGVGQSSAPAKAICAGCPVSAECLDFALTTNIEAGVYGGLTIDERNRLRPKARTLRPISHGTEGGYRTHLRRGEDACQACTAAAAEARDRRAS